MSKINICNINKPKYLLSFIGTNSLAFFRAGVGVEYPECFTNRCICGNYSNHLVECPLYSLEVYNSKSYYDLCDYYSSHDFSGFREALCPKMFSLGGFDMATGNVCRSYKINRRIVMEEYVQGVVDDVSFSFTYPGRMTSMSDHVMITIFAEDIDCVLSIEDCYREYGKGQRYFSIQVRASHAYFMSFDTHQWKIRTEKKIPIVKTYAYYYDLNIGYVKSRLPFVDVDYPEWNEFVVKHGISAISVLGDCRYGNQRMYQVHFVEQHLISPFHGFICPAKINAISYYYNMVMNLMASGMGSIRKSSDLFKDCDVPVLQKSLISYFTCGSHSNGYCDTKYSFERFAKFVGVSPTDSCFYGFNNYLSSGLPYVPYIAESKRGEHHMYMGCAICKNGEVAGSRICSVKSKHIDVFLSYSDRFCFEGLNCSDGDYRWWGTDPAYGSCAYIVSNLGVLLGGLKGNASNKLDFCNFCILDDVVCGHYRRDFGCLNYVKDEYVKSRIVPGWITKYNPSHAYLLGDELSFGMLVFDGNRNSNTALEITNFFLRRKRMDSEILGSYDGFVEIYHSILSKYEQEYDYSVANRIEFSMFLSEVIRITKDAPFISLFKYLLGEFSHYGNNIVYYKEGDVKFLVENYFNMLYNYYGCVEDDFLVGYYIIVFDKSKPLGVT